jgi:hypothetical protein
VDEEGGGVGGPRAAAQRPRRAAQGGTAGATATDGPPTATCRTRTSENTRNGRHAYSVLKALRQSDPMSKHESLDGMELEVHQELAKQRSRPRRGADPVGPAGRPGAPGRAYRERAGIERRDLTVTTGAGAVYEVVSTTMIEFLRNMMLARRLGARVMTGMNGNFTIPKQTGHRHRLLGHGGQCANRVDPDHRLAVDVQPSTLGAFSDYSGRSSADLGRRRAVRPRGPLDGPGHRAGPAWRSTERLGPSRKASSRTPTSTWS